jgi:hypothetical protein
MISISCTEAYSVFGAQQPQDITNKQCSSYMLQEPADRRIANPQKKNRKSQPQVTWARDFKKHNKTQAWHEMPSIEPLSFNYKICQWL